MNTATLNALNIITNPAVQLKPGMFVSTQLGNRMDSDWCPNATVLLLHTTVSFFGDIQFTGLYKDEDGGYYIARYLIEHNDRERHQATTSETIGVAYCTCSVPMDMITASSSYLGARENETLAMALRIHREKVAMLPTVRRFVKDQLVTA